MALRADRPVPACNDSTRRRGNFELINEHGENVISDYFRCRKNILTCAVDIRIFMATENKSIALNDCLFYVVKVRG